MCDGGRGKASQVELLSRHAITAQALLPLHTDRDLECTCGSAVMRGEGACALLKLASLLLSPCLFCGMGDAGCAANAVHGPGIGSPNLLLRTPPSGTDTECACGDEDASTLGTFKLLVN